jgi:adenosine/AMP kinase
LDAFDACHLSYRFLSANEIYKKGILNTQIDLLLRNAFPINVLNQIKLVPEVCNIHAATANPLQVLVAETCQGRGIIGVIDGHSSQGFEKEQERAHRIQFLRDIGYKVQ